LGGAEMTTTTSLKKIHECFIAKKPNKLKLFQNQAAVSTAFEQRWRFYLKISGPFKQAYMLFLVYFTTLCQ
jgi:hypothetical protein